MNIDSIQEQRAKNIIWNAAGDYHFVPDYAAYEKDGAPSLYFNCIIGSVHRYYNYAPIHDMLLRLGRLREANLFRGLVWLGLERCTYEHALTDRPLLTTLRASYSQTVWDQRTSYWDQELFDRLNTAHFGAVIGHHSRLSKKEQALLADLEFDSTLTSEQIVEHMNHLMELYFHCSIPPLHDKRRFPVFPVRFRKAALHGGALITTVQSSGDTKQKKQLTLWLPALRAETRNQKLRQFLEDSFGLSLYALEDLEKLEKKQNTADTDTQDTEQSRREQELHSMVAEGMEYIRHLRDLNDRIEGEAISEKLYRLENLLKEIFDRVQEHPEQMHRMHKLMDYYLPTMLKLVEQYAEFDEISSPGDDILDAKKEIEKTLDMINQAFVTLLNNLFRDAAFDASADAQVLQTMLAKEGLTESDFVREKSV